MRRRFEITIKEVGREQPIKTDYIGYATHISTLWTSSDSTNPMWSGTDSTTFTSLPNQKASNTSAATNSFETARDNESCRNAGLCR